MANDVVNPYQLFRDRAGRPLAAGKLRILVNRTSALGTAFSDSALQVAQTVDPYILDTAGRVTGDLRWTGERTVEVYDSNDELIRTLNDVVTLVDTSDFAINELDVASMVANTSLALGDVVETQSYSDTLKQGYGGARYLVVAALTGTDDGYTYHDLDNGLQAELIDLEQNKNFYVAGAIGSGVVDDSAAVQAVLAVGGAIECSNGIFRCEALTLSLSSRIYGDGTLILTTFATSDLLAITGADLFITFDGITIDGDSDNQVLESARKSITSALTASADSFAGVMFNNVTFQNGPQYDVDAAGDDSATGSVLYTFAECRFLGGLESTITPFLTAAINATDGVSVVLEDCYFDLTRDPGVIGGRGGVQTSNATFANPGYLSVNECTFNRIGVSVSATGIRGAIHAREVQQLIIGELRMQSCQGAAIAWGAEVDSVTIGGNQIDSLIGTTTIAGLVSLVSTQATPGDNWQIEGNELTGITGVGILIDGATAGVDVSNVSIDGNTIDAPTLQAILFENINGADIRDNQIDMASVTGIDAIAVDADGVAGMINVEGNTVANCDAAGFTTNGSSNTGATFVVDGNPITGGVDGIRIENAAGAYITNNPLENLSGVLVDLDTITDAMLDGNSNGGTAPATYARAAAVTNLVVGENLWPQVDSSITNVAGAAIAITAHYHEITAATTITSATFAGDVIGFVVVLRATVSVTVNDSATINLTGNFAMTADDTLTLAWDGAAFNEVSRSVN